MELIRKKILQTFSRGKKWEVPSNTEDGIFCEVNFVNNIWYCLCASLKKGDCKHIKFIKFHTKNDKI